MNVLNLYAGIGGNRKLWKGHDVTAVEYDPAIAHVYQSSFPRDILIVGDAHEYLLAHYQEFDLIWSSPPCPTHGQYRYNVGVRAKGYKAVFPDMKLYEEIVFLQYYFKGRWVVENVRPYYEPLITPTVVLQRHLFWSNFPIAQADFGATHLRTKNKIADFADAQVLARSNISNKRQVLRNCVDPQLGGHVMRCAVKPTLIAAE
jgi:DNA (cytosine-5)-methyltransferase 1